MVADVHSSTTRQIILFNMNIITWLSGKKTYIVASLMVLIGIVNFVTGDIGFIEFITSENILILLNGLGMGGLRHSIR